MRAIDKEMILICAMMAIVGALGIVAVVLVFAGRTIESCNAAVLAGAFCGLSGLLWGILLVFNLEK